jgi:hypothetical protein
VPRRTRQHRTQVDRAGITTLTGASGSTIAHWLRHRDKSGFPVKADTDADGRDWWWLDEIETFWDNHLAARAAGFTTVDRTGDPDDLLNAPQAAAVLGYESHRNLPKVLLDQYDDAERLPSGRLRRYWYRRSLWDYADGRPLRHSTGRPPGTLADQRQPHPYADDPRLEAAISLLREAHATGGGTSGLGAQLAQRLDINLRTAQRLIAAAHVATGGTV